MNVLRRVWSRYPQYSCWRDTVKPSAMFAGISRFSRSYGVFDLKCKAFGGCNTILQVQKSPFNPKQSNKLFHDQMQNEFTTTEKDSNPTSTVKDEKYHSFRPTNNKSKKFGFHEYEFDENGYLSVDDVVQFLRREAAFDICVIKTTGAQQAYVDYFVVVCGVSTRHIRAMSKNLEQLFRGQNVRGVGKDGHVTVEGLGTDSWQALDIGNMAVHFFLPETRAIYELEKLWTLGPKYDDQHKALLEEEQFLKAVFVGEAGESQE